MNILNIHMCVYLRVGTHAFFNKIITLCTLLSRQLRTLYAMKGNI